MSLELLTIVLKTGEEIVVNRGYMYHFCNCVQLLRLYKSCRGAGHTLTAIRQGLRYYFFRVNHVYFFFAVAEDVLMICWRGFRRKGG